MTTTSKVRTAICLTLPIWGTVLATRLIIHFKDEGVAKLIIMVGIMLIAFSSAPIINSAKLTTGEKVGLTLAYFFLSAICVLVLGLFLFCMNKCS